jgi:hypothetical protein
MSNETNKLNSFFTHEVTLVRSDHYANQNGKCIICKGDEMTKVKDSTDTSLEKCASIAAQPLSPGRFIASTHLVITLMLPRSPFSHKMRIFPPKPENPKHIVPSTSLSWTSA